MTVMTVLLLLSQRQRDAGGTKRNYGAGWLHNSVIDHSYQTRLQSNFSLFLLSRYFYATIGSEFSLRVKVSACLIEGKESFDQPATAV